MGIKHHSPFSHAAEKPGHTKPDARLSLDVLKKSPIPDRDHSKKRRRRSPDLKTPIQFPASQDRDHHQSPALEKK
jgi:hypothetical protein